MNNRCRFSYMDLWIIQKNYHFKTFGKEKSQHQQQKLRVITKQWADKRCHRGVKNKNWKIKGEMPGGGKWPISCSLENKSDGSEGQTPSSSGRPCEWVHQHSCAISTNTSIFRTPRAEEWRIRQRYQRDWASNKPDNGWLKWWMVHTSIPERSTAWEHTVTSHHGCVWEKVTPGQINHILAFSWIFIIVLYWQKKLYGLFKFIKELEKLSKFLGTRRQAGGFLISELLPYLILYSAQQALSPFLPPQRESELAPPEGRSRGQTRSEAPGAQLHLQFTRHFGTGRVTAANSKVNLCRCCGRAVRPSLHTNGHT